MKRAIFLCTLLALFATPALAKDPNFNIENYCKRTQQHKTAYRNCIDEEKAVRDDVRAMKMSDAVFNRCLDRAKKNPDEANYYSFMTCVENASQKK